MTKMLIVTPMIYELLKDYEEQNAVNQWIHRNTIDTIAKQYSYLEKENQQLKSVLNEVRRYMNTLCDEYADDNYDIKCEVLETICQKLDKVGDK